MKSIKSITLFITVLFFLGSCDQVFNPVPVSEEIIVEETSSYDWPVLSGNNGSGNFRISTANLSEEHLFCVDGDAVGIIMTGNVVTVEVDASGNGLRNFWLIPLTKINNSDDIIYNNVSYSWIAKVYDSGNVREWVPGESDTDGSGEVTFTTPAFNTVEWDLIIGYLDGDETSAPIAVLSPYDSYGVKSLIEYGRLCITWKFFHNSVEVGESSSDIVVTEEDLNKRISVPEIQVPVKKTVSLLFENYESSIIRLYLNGSPIEEAMTDSISGYSYIEGFSFRSFSELEVDDNNVLTVADDSGELDRLSFTAEEGEAFFTTFTYDGGIQFSPVYNRSEYDYILDAAQFELDFEGDYVNYSNPAAGYSAGGVSFTEDRFGRANSAMSLNNYLSSLDVSDYSDLGIFESQEFTYNLWVRSYERKDRSIILSYKNSYYDYKPFTLLQDSANGLEVRFEPDSYTGFEYVIRTGDTSLNDGMWHMITVTKDQYSAEVYVDGKLVNRKEGLSPISYTYGTLSFSGIVEDDSLYFKGAYDDFRYYSKVLCKEEIDVLYRENGGVY